jgi:hypothetical protein
MPPVAWSYSTLDSFEVCGRNHYHVRVANTYPYKQNQGAFQGDVAHEAMKKYLTRKEPPPPALIKLARIADRVCAGAEEVLVECKRGLTVDLQPCGYFDNNSICCRIIVDLMARHESGAIIVDWKSSSQPRETPEQLDIQSWMVFANYPEIDVVEALFVYTEHKTRRFTFHRNDWLARVEKFRPRLQAFHNAFISGGWDPNPGCWKCRKFCPVQTCEYHGR